MAEDTHTASEEQAQVVDQSSNFSFDDGSSEVSSEDAKQETLTEDASKDTPQEQPAVGEGQEEELGSGDVEIPKPLFNTEQQAVFNREIGKKVAQYKAKEEEAARLRELVQYYESVVPPTQNKNDIPEAPDAYDPDYDDKMAQRDAAIARKAILEEQNARFNEETKKNSEEKARETYANVRASANKYVERSKALGIDPEHLDFSGKVLSDSGISTDLALHILEDRAGPLLTVHLANNPEDLSKIMSMQPVKAGIFLEELKAKMSIKGKTRAPNPIDTNNGSGRASSSAMSVKRGYTYEAG